MRFTHLIMLFVLATSVTGGAFPTAQAADKKPIPTDLEPLPEALPPPTVIEGGAAEEPEITIVNKGENTVEEYRMHGELYMQKITPSHGTPYYLLKEDQQGAWSRFDGPAGQISIPKWVIFRF